MESESAKNEAENPKANEELGPVKNALDEVSPLVKQIKEYHQELLEDGKEDSIKTRINDYRDQLLVDADGSPSIRTEVEQLHTTVSAQAGEVKKFHDEVFVDGESHSLKTQISTAHSDALAQAGAIKSFHDQVLVDGDSLSTKTQINNFYNGLFQDTEEKKGVATQINQAHQKSLKQSGEIDDLHDRLLVDGEGENAETCLQTDIDKFYTELFEDGESSKAIKTQINELHTEATGKRNDILAYHKELLVDGEELPSTKTQIGNYFTKTQREFAELKLELTKRIEDLLPMAAAAGLASSYNTAREGYAHGFSRFMYYTLLLLPLIYCIHIYTNPPASLVELEAAVMAGKADYTTLMIFRALLALPLLAISLFGFSSLRLSRRMAEEYNHKQRVMELYTGFKKEIDDLAIKMANEQEGLKLKNELLKIMLRTVEQHPSQAMKEVDRGWLGDLVQIMGKRAETAKEELPSLNINAGFSKPGE